MGQKAKSSLKSEFSVKHITVCSMKQVQYTEGSFPVSGFTYPKIDDQKNFRPSYHPCLEDQQD